MAFDENLKKVQTVLGLSNYALAKLLDCSQTSIANWISGARIPHAKTRMEIAQAFGFTIDELDGELPDNYADILLKKEKAPTQEGERSVSDDDIKFALFGGDGDITDAMFDEVKRFAQMVKLREEAEKGKK